MCWQEQTGNGGLSRRTALRGVVVLLLTMVLIGLWVHMPGDVASIWAAPTGGSKKWSNKDTEQLVPTNIWIDLYSTQSVMDGEPLPVGTEIRAYDPQGTLSGKFTVTTPGSYGVMPVYGDDPATLQDEGAITGDLITVVAGDLRTCTTPAEVRWAAPGDVLQPGDLLQVDLEAFSKVAREKESRPDGRSGAPACPSVKSP